MSEQNAVIKSTQLGPEGHGILSISLSLDYGGSIQGFGGYDLRSADSLARWVNGILEVVGVESWENLRGEHIRVRREDGWNGKILALGNFLEDKWFDPNYKE